MSDRLYKKPDCAKHSSEITHFGDNYTILAKELGDLKYDALACFLRELAEKLMLDSKNDKKGGREKLAAALEEASELINESATSIEDAWAISEPFMSGKASAPATLDGATPPEEYLEHDWEFSTTTPDDKYSLYKCKHCTATKSYRAGSMNSELIHGQIFCNKDK